jgi:aerobic-type carbon monoxide dehydrogenase small subunit (CoxS/CutS family)
VSAHPITLHLNGELTSAVVRSEELLLDFLREQRQLTGAKRSCDVEVCGACTVLVDGAPVSACCFLASEVDGREVLTIEGLTQLPEFAALEQAFMRRAAVQCGFCTPGMLLTIHSLLQDGTLGTDEQSIREGLSGNLCRCTGYQAILEAVSDLLHTRRGG